MFERQWITLQKNPLFMLPNFLKFLYNPELEKEKTSVHKNSNSLNSGFYTSINSENFEFLVCLKKNI